MVKKTLCPPLKMSARFQITIRRVIGVMDEKADCPRRTRHRPKGSISLTSSCRTQAQMLKVWYLEWSNSQSENREACTLSRTSFKHYPSQGSVIQNLNGRADQQTPEMGCEVRIAVVGHRMEKYPWFRAVQRSLSDVSDTWLTTPRPASGLR